jgi:adenosylcobalamin-dependent ribonucleoside-triphosphate reductase
MSQSQVEVAQASVARRVKSFTRDSEPFTLSADFIERYVGQQPAWGEVGYVTYRRTYARSLDSVPTRIRNLGRHYGLREHEEFWLTAVRVVEGCFLLQQQHCTESRLPWSNQKAQKSAQDMFDRLWTFKWLPPGRGLWMMGTERVLDGRAGAAAFNCGAVTTSNIDDDLATPFCWLMDMSMLGVGVGFDCTGAGTIVIQEPEVDGLPHVVADSREGWVGALRVVLNAFTGKNKLPRGFDTSSVREYGAAILGFGGTASGPGPLLEMLTAIIRILTNLQGQLITTLAIVDIANIIGRCVVAGNVRRSALLAAAPLAGSDFINFKDYTKYPKRGNWGWASNNSILAEIGMDYTEVARSTGHNGEPGFLWLENMRRFGRMKDAANDRDHNVVATNPCGEITLEDRELCNICSVYPAAHDSYEDFERTIKMAYLYNKTVTLISTHDNATNAVMLRNRRIGVSAAGIAQAEAKHGRRTLMGWLDRGYGYVRRLDAIYSDWLCIPRSIKTTTVKPDGTSALLNGATPGVHYAHNEFYMRVIRFDSGSPLVKIYRDAGYRCEVVKKEPNTTAIYFPVQEKLFARGKADVSMWEQLELVAQLQENWVDNAVSATIHFKKDEAKDIAHALTLYEARLKTISFMPYVSPDEERAEFERMGYEHAPYQAVDRDAFARYAASLKPARLGDDVSHEVTDKFCDGDRCVMPVPAAK